MSDSEAAGDLAERMPDRLWRIQKLVATVNRAVATAVTNAPELAKGTVLPRNLDDVHGALLDTYENLTEAIDEVEHALDEADASTRGPTPRQLKREHADRIKEQFDGPVLNVALQMLEANRRKWLHRKRGTNGAEDVARHGLTENQRTWLYDLEEAWRQADIDHGDGTPPEADGDGKDLDEVYRDRNLAACAFVKSWSRDLLPGGWTPGESEPDAWAIVWLETPQGQVSWHVPREMAERLLERNDDYEYDGHDDEAKRARLARWTEGGCRS